MGQHNVYVPMLFTTYNKCVAENNFPFIIFLKCLFIYLNRFFGPGLTEITHCPMTIGSLLCKDYFEGHMDSVSHRKGHRIKDRRVCIVWKSWVGNGRRE